jgi:hypothetical protein
LEKIKFKTNETINSSSNQKSLVLWFYFFKNLYI